MPVEHAQRPDGIVPQRVYPMRSPEVRPGGSVVRTRSTSTSTLIPTGKTVCLQLDCRRLVLRQEVQHFRRTTAAPQDAHHVSGHCSLPARSSPLPEPTAQPSVGGSLPSLFQTRSSGFTRSFTLQRVQPHPWTVLLSILDIRTAYGSGRRSPVTLVCGPRR